MRICKISELIDNILRSGQKKKKSNKSVFMRCCSVSTICEDQIVYKGSIAQLDSKVTGKYRVSITYLGRDSLSRDAILIPKLILF